MSKFIDDATFNIKYQMYANTVFKIAFNYVHNSMDAEDIVQNVFLKYCRHYKIFPSLDDEKYWLIRLSINESINFLKQSFKKHEINTDDLTYIPSQEEPNDETQEQIKELVDKLPNNYKMVIILYYYQEMSIEEVANSLHLSIPNVKKRLERGRNILKKGLNDYE